MNLNIIVSLIILAPFIVIIGLSGWGIRFFKKQGKTTITTISRIIFFLGITGAIVVGFLCLLFLPDVHTREEDDRRVADLFNVRNSIELYFDQNKVYPSAPNWKTLETVLKNANIGITQLPDDPDPKRSYNYRVSPNGDRYVIRAFLDASRDYNFGNDFNRRGKILGLSCDDTAFCLIAEERITITPSPTR